jgi:HD superfamily phosphodiesterase
MSRVILKSAEKFVTDLYNENDNGNLLFHSLKHAVNVVNHINEIASHYELEEKQIVALNIAGWFHDVGHLFTTPLEHEIKSAEIAEKWMTDNELSKELISMVNGLILVTKNTAVPSTLVERIIKDADTYHFGTKDLKKTDKLLKEEMRLRNFTTMLTNWNQSKIDVLQNHEFYTDYAKNLLGNGKEKNLARAKNKSEDQNSENAGTTLLLNEKGENAKEAAKQNGFIAKGIQTMLRLTSANHVSLSEMADSKANILISVNAIIISLILSVLIRKIEVDTYLAIPTLIFLATSVITIVLAIIATRPKITKGNFTKEDVVHGKTNLLFFGNFYKTTLDEYKWGMSMMMRDPNYLYGGLVDDIYYLGVVLGKKYKFLSIAYYVFMIGIIISVFSFVFAIWMHQPNEGVQIQNATGSPF